MTGQGTVYDLGYTPHDGERLGRAGAIRAMLIDGLRRSLGLRRKPWAKVLPWALVAAAIVPAAWAVALTKVISGLTLEDMGPFGDPRQFFDVIGTLCMLFVALITPTLLIPDRRHRVLSIYASRPIYSTDYLMARAATVLFLTLLYILIPQTTLFVGISSLHIDGLLAGLANNADLIPEILGSTMAYVIGYGAPAFLVSLYVGRVAIATGVYVVGMFMTGAIADSIPYGSDLLIYKFLAPLSLFFNPMSVRDWLFEGDFEGPALAAVGLPPWVAAAAIVGVATLTGVLAVRKYRREL